MSRTVTIPDALYIRLEQTAHARGFSSIAQLLAVWQSHEDTLRHRQEAVARIDALRERLFATYGVFQDSTEEIREDRTR
ncbi:MAG: hypothetical protein ACRERE_08625 [Candidatus Entotheonellia bacterium]